MAPVLDVVDLQDLTLDEIRKLKKEALVRVKEIADRPIDELAMHQNHGSHSDHATKIQDPVGF
jgi:hypothetical protein